MRRNGCLFNDGFCYVWNHKRTWRVYCQLRLNLPRRTKRRVPKRERQPLWIEPRLNAVWALDFMRDTLYSGRVFRTLNAIDEVNRALGIEIAVSISAARVIAFLTQMSDLHGLPAAIRCDKRPAANQPDVHRLVQGAGHRAALQPGRKARPERLHRAFQPDLPRGGAEYDLFDSLDEVRDITADWLDRYNEIRPHDALGSLPPARYRERLLAAQSPV